MELVVSKPLFPFALKLVLGKQIVKTEGKTYFLYFVGGGSMECNFSSLHQASPQPPLPTHSPTPHLLPTLLGWKLMAALCELLWYLNKLL